jgi:hypothetical protein
MRRLLLAALVTGFLFYLVGWAGNEFVLSHVGSPHAPRGLPPTALQFVSDVILGLVWCLVYRLLSPTWRRSKMQLALVSAGIVWLGGVANDIMSINGGHLPLGIAIATTLLALVTFLIVAPLLPRLLPDRVVTPT